MHCGSEKLDGRFNAVNVDLSGGMVDVAMLPLLSEVVAFVRSNFLFCCFGLKRMQTGRPERECVSAECLRQDTFPLFCGRVLLDPVRTKISQGKDRSISIRSD